MSQLLVSVRNVVEAKAALAGGANWLDVKEPANGPLGYADRATIEAVVCGIAGRRPVSAACGELIDEPAAPPAGIRLAKCGLRDAGPTWEQKWRLWRNRLACDAVAVAYAEGEEVGAPPVDAVVALAIAERPSAFLIDTAVKDGRCLLDWLSVPQLQKIADRLANESIPLALAGSLNAIAIQELRGIAPRWFAVRSAACDGGRMGTINAHCVRDIMRFCAGPCCRGAGRIG